jgi:hypothetical protein
MPDNFIAVSYANRLGSQLVNLSGSLALDKARLSQIKADMDQMTDGLTFATIEATYGIPVGKGQTVYNLVTGALAAMNGSADFLNLLAFLAAGF